MAEQIQNNGTSAIHAAALQFKGGAEAVMNMPDENRIMNLIILVVQRTRHASLPERFDFPIDVILFPDNLFSC